MMKLRNGIVLAILCVLAACSSNTNAGRGQELVGVATQLLDGLRGSKADGESQQLTRAMIDDLGATAMLMMLPARNSRAVVTPIGNNGGKVTWGSQDGISVTTQSGFLLGTRGLGGDLMGVDVEGFGPVFAARQGTYRRKMEWLDGLDGADISVFTCTLTTAGKETLTIVERRYDTVRYDDQCVGESVVFTNRYWVDSSRTLRQSQQFVSKSVGYLLSQAL